MGQSYQVCIDTSIHKDRSALYKIGTLLSNYLKTQGEEYKLISYNHRQTKLNIDSESLNNDSDIRLFNEEEISNQLTFLLNSLSSNYLLVQDESKLLLSLPPNSLSYLSNSLTSNRVEFFGGSNTHSYVEELLESISNLQYNKLLLVNEKGLITPWLSSLLEYICISNDLSDTVPNQILLSSNIESIRNKLAFYNALSLPLFERVYYIEPEAINKFNDNLGKEENLESIYYHLLTEGKELSSKLIEYEHIGGVKPNPLLLPSNIKEDLTQLEYLLGYLLSNVLLDKFAIKLALIGDKMSNDNLLSRKIGAWFVIVSFLMDIDKRFENIPLETGIYGDFMNGFYALTLS